MSAGAGGVRRFAVLAALLLYVGEALPQSRAPDAMPAPGDMSSAVLEERIRRDRLSLSDPFVITPHKPNYILPVTYNSRPNKAPLGALEENLDSVEMKFQLSLKFAAWRRIFGDNGHLVFGYTQRAYWQAYNRDVSSPFRETNHEPEAMLTFLNDFEALGFRNRVLRFGLVHQSNGRAGDFSRSWDRVYVEFLLVRGNLVLGVKPWYRIPEEADEDDNPDIEDYMGHGELSAVFKAGRHVFGLMMRNNLESEDNRGAVQIDWSYPVKDRVRGYVQYFNGYGESLIDYDASVNRIGVGLMLSNWL